MKTRARARSIVYDKVRGIYLVSVLSSPRAGKANDEVIAVMATELRVAKSLISIKSGHKSATKTIELNK